MDYLKPSGNFLNEVEQKSSYVCNPYWCSAPHIFGVNSELNLDRGLHRYSELLIFVVFPYVRILTTYIQNVSNFHFGLLFKTAHFHVIFHHTMIATLSQRQQYI
jgi:hypothetical protein